METYFTAKIIGIGNSYGVIIPKGIVEMLNKDEKYRFIIKEGVKDGNETSSLLDR